MIIEVFFLFTVYYVTRALVFEHKPSHQGPWPSEHKRVQRVFEDAEGKTMTYSYPVNFFDYVRRFFGLYKVGKEFWLVREERLEVWTCTFCLSFWVALLAGALICFTQGDGQYLFFYAFGGAGFSSWMNR